MKLHFKTIAAALLVAAQSSAQSPLGIDHVFVIGVEGLTVEGLYQAKTPNIDRMMREGSYSFAQRCVLPTSCIINFGAMLTGVPPEVNGILENSYNRNIDEIAPAVMTRHRQFPSVYSVIRQQRPDAVLASICDDNFSRMLETDVMDYYHTAQPQSANVRELCAYIKDKKPTFLFTHLEDVDSMLHDHGVLSPEYISAVEKTDGEVQQLIDAYKAAGIMDRSLIILASDHGGLRRGHSKANYEEINTPIIYYGAGVKHGYHIRQAIYKYDTAADVIFALGLKIPACWRGRPVYPAFKGYDEPDEVIDPSTLVKVVPTPILSTSENGCYGDVAVDRPVEITITRPLGAGQTPLHYTTDGTVPTAKSLVYTAPLKLKHSAVVKAKFIDADCESMTASGHYRVADSKKGNGLVCKYYNLPEQATMPDLADKKPLLTATAYEMVIKDKTFPELKAFRQAHPNYYGFKAEGWMKIDETAKYTFRVWSVGGFRLFVDGKQVCYNARLTNGGYADVDLQLERGAHAVRLDYFAKGSVRDYVDVYYEKNKGERHFVAADMLFKTKSAALK